MALAITLSRQQSQVPLSKSAMRHKSVLWVCMQSSYLGLLLQCPKSRTKDHGSTRSCRLSNTEIGKTYQPNFQSGSVILKVKRDSWFHLNNWDGVRKNWPVDSSTRALKRWQDQAVQTSSVASVSVTTPLTSPWPPQKLACTPQMVTCWLSHSKAPYKWLPNLASCKWIQRTFWSFPGE